MNSKKIKSLLNRAIPLWVVIALIIDSSFLTAIGQYYLMKKNFADSAKELAKTTQNPDELIQLLKQEVLPIQGYKTSLKWKDLGKQLVDAGVIDKEKFAASLAKDENSQDNMKYMDGNWDENISINESNAHFIVNFFWALGLVNKSKVLDEGPMKSNGDLGNYASTGGWTLGTKEATAFYSSREIIELTSEQQDLVKKIAENVFRPCCGNPTSFPDCNHGMAALGYIEWAVKNGLSEDQIYKDLLAFNSFWFPQNYVEMAAFFNKQNIKWNKVDAKLALSSNYSSGQGAQRIKQSVQGLPGFQTQGGGGCGA